jgi:hypothetical protein
VVRGEWKGWAVKVGLSNEVDEAKLIESIHQRILRESAASVLELKSASLASYTDPEYRAAAVLVQSLSEAQMEGLAELVRMVKCCAQF